MEGVATFGGSNTVQDYAIKLALLGFRHSVEWWGLPTRPDWALAPDWGALGYQTGSWVSCAWPSGVCVAPGCRNFSPLAACLYSVQSTLPEAGGQSPGRVLGVTPWGFLPTRQFPTHANSCWLAGHRPSGCVPEALR